MALQNTLLKQQESAKRIKARFVAISWRDLAISFGPIVLLAIVAIWLAIWLIDPAPPKTITTNQRAIVQPPTPGNKTAAS